MSSTSINSTNSSNTFPTSSTPPSAENINNNIPRLAVGTSSNSPACAVCKYRRRRCAADCQLAPYFPADRQKDFLNAHKLFGVSNMIRVLDSIKDPARKEIAMKTMIFQANVRANDPTRGCCRIIDNLQRQELYYKAELDHVLHLLEVYRSQNLHGGVQDYTSYNNNNNMQDQFVRNDVESHHVRDYLDEMDMAESLHKTYNHMHDFGLGDTIEQTNNGVGVNGDEMEKFNHFRSKVVREYMNNEPSALESHIKFDKELATATSLFPLRS